MTEKELLSLNELFSELKSIMKKYGRYEQRFQFNNVCDIIDIINSDLPKDDKSELVKERYKRLYHPHGGLGDFCILDDNIEKMQELNIPLDNVKNKIWDIMQNYV